MTEGSAHRTTIAVRTVFRCVASRNRAPTGPFGRESSDRESSALRPPPEALRAWAHRPRDAKHRDWFSPQARPHAFLRALPPRRGERAGRLPLGRDAQRLLLPASTLSETSRAPGPKNFPPPCYARRSLSARLGDSFYFAKSEIVESLLRRGARVPLGTRKLELARQQAKTALTPGGRCLPALGMGHSGEKTFFGRAPGRFILFCS